MAKKESASAAELLPIRMLHDRVLVSLETEGERRSGGGILIPRRHPSASASPGPRSSPPPHRAPGAARDRVLFDPEERAEVELQGKGYVLLRERDIHAVAAQRVEDGQTGLYL